MATKQGATNLMESLQLSIANGDEGQAKMVAALLAKKKLIIDMDMPLDRGELLKDDDLMLKVYVEDRTSSCCVPLKVKKNARIKDLKLKMLRDYGFPPQVQRWIIGKRLPSDNDTLHKLGVKTPESPLFLYLFPSKKVLFSKENFVTQYYEEAPGEVINKHFQGVPRHREPELNATAEAAAIAAELPSPGARATPLSSTTPNRSSTQEIQFPEVNVPVNHENLAGEGEHLSEELVGWECKVCTFINLPTRPGCAMCSEARPDDYHPPADYQPTGEEQARLKRLTDEEQEAELARALLLGNIDLPQPRPQVRPVAPINRQEDLLVLTDARGETVLIPENELDPAVFEDFLNLQVTDVGRGHIANLGNRNAIDESSDTSL